MMQERGDAKSSRLTLMISMRWSAGALRAFTRGSALLVSLPCTSPEEETEPIEVCCMARLVVGHLVGHRGGGIPTCGAGVSKWVAWQGRRMRTTTVEDATAQIADSASLMIESIGCR